MRKIHKTFGSHNGSPTQSLYAPKRKHKNQISHHDKTKKSSPDSLKRVSCMILDGKPKDHWSCIAYLSADDRLISGL